MIVLFLLSPLHNLLFDKAWCSSLMGTLQLVCGHCCMWVSSTVSLLLALLILSAVSSASASASAAVVLLGILIYDDPFVQWHPKNHSKYKQQQIVIQTFPRLEEDDIKVLPVLDDTTVAVAVAAKSKIVSRFFYFCDTMQCLQKRYRVPFCCCVLAPAPFVVNNDNDDVDWYWWWWWSCCSYRSCCWKTTRTPYVDMCDVDNFCIDFDLDHMSCI